MNHYNHNNNKVEKIIYICPMHPEIKQEKQGLCPECGMNLIKMKSADMGTQHGRKKGNPKHENLRSGAHEKHQGHSTEMFFKKFLVSLILTIPVLFYSDIIRNFLPFKLPSYEVGIFELNILIPAILGSVIFFYGGGVFLLGAWREIKSRLPGMMTLIGIAISAAYLWSVYAVFAGAETLFWELATLITIMLLGHFLEMRAVSGAQGALKELSKLLPDTAERIKNYELGIKNKEQLETEIVPLSELRAGDYVLVKPGGKIPADGIITDGESDVNESMITGESKPVYKKQNDGVIAGTINGDGALKIKVSQIGEKTFLAGVMRLVAEAQASKSRLQILSDRAALYLTIVAVAGGAITFVAWFLSGATLSFAVARLVAVLVIACPHALGLAVPLVASISTTKAARSGFLVKQRLALEAARTIDMVLFDKTGTLTKGEFGVAEIFAVPETTKDEVLALAASLDVFSEHPIAKAVVTKAKEQKLPLSEPKKFEALKGRGVTAFLEGKEVMVGSAALVESVKVKIPDEFQKSIQKAGRNGETIIFIIKDKKLLGALTLADLVREESREAIKILQDLGVSTSMITGDSEDVAKSVSREIGISEYFARVLPEEKSKKVKELQKRDLKVAMVGDGVNDAPALTQADLGIAIGAGTNVAIESAGIILVRNDPRDIAKIIKLSRLTYTKMIQNLFWATGYNVVALPLAAGVLAFKGILLEPALAAVFMSFSTVIVAVNALFLRRRKI